METVNISISPKILQWIEATVSLSEENKIILEEWKNGENPTLNQLEEFSKSSHIPFGYFFLKTPPKENLDLLEFRTIDSINLQNSSRSLVETVFLMEDIQDWMRDYVKQTTGEKLSFVGSINKNDDIQKTAEYILNSLNIPKDWYKRLSEKVNLFKTLREAISSTGVTIMLNDCINIEEFRAFTLIDDFAPLIFINNKDTEKGKIFSLIHEYVYISIGCSDFFNATSKAKTLNYVNPNETFCNAVTKEIITPILDFIMENKKSQNSNRAGAYRIDRRFLKALEESVKEEKTSYTEAFRLTSTNGSSFEQLIEEAKVK